MQAVDIIIKKRDGRALSKAEIDFFIEGVTREEIPDYQTAAWLMAVLLNGMTDQETTDLTLAMAHSGEMLDLSAIVPLAVDKHSTGGVGDKTTLVVEPLVAACGVPVGKMSGKGLGFSGGTLDKLESIPGYRIDLSTKEFLQQLKQYGLVLSGQSADLAPADGKLYALRDVTGTVKSTPLIASSVMSKKLASGAEAIVLDVKCGVGAFMKSLDEARHLAEAMVTIAQLAGRKAVAVLADMNQPLGCTVGNALEVKESIETLHCAGPMDFREHCLEIAAHMLVLGEKAPDMPFAREMARTALDSGQAWERFVLLVKTQGGDVDYINHPERLPTASYRSQVQAQTAGYVNRVDARIVGETALFLGAGRRKKGEPIDHAVGIEVHVKVGDQVQRGAKLFTIHANHESRLKEAEEKLLAAVPIVPNPVDPLPLFYGVVR
jgi:pyrimidine-nucleoside phosphorylase